MDGTSPLKLAVIALAVIAAFVLGLGLLLRTGESAAHQAVAANASTNFFSEQQKMMREALQMAKEAQQLQRERMQETQRMMQEAEYGEQTAYIEGASEH